MNDQPCLEVPFHAVEKWEKIEGSCARLYAAAEWGYKKGLKEQRSIALRALADQVVPEPSDLDKTLLSLATIRTHCRVRDAILAIATELEGHEK